MCVCVCVRERERERERERHEECASFKFVLLNAKKTELCIDQYKILF